MWIYIYNILYNCGLDVCACVYVHCWPLWERLLSAYQAVDRAQAESSKTWTLINTFVNIVGECWLENVKLLIRLATIRQYTEAIRQMPV